MMRAWLEEGKEEKKCFGVFIKANPAADVERANSAIINSSSGVVVKN